MQCTQNGTSAKRANATGDVLFDAHSLESQSQVVREASTHGQGIVGQVHAESYVDVTKASIGSNDRNQCVVSQLLAACKVEDLKR